MGVDDRSKLVDNYLFRRDENRVNTYLYENIENLNKIEINDDEINEFYHAWNTDSLSLNEKRNTVDLVTFNDDLTKILDYI